MGDLLANSRWNHVTLATTARGGRSFPPGARRQLSDALCSCSALTGPDRQAHDLRVVVRVLVVELRVRVHDVVLVRRLLSSVWGHGQGGADQDVVQHLAVALIS